MNNKVIIGLGSGRCGTLSLALLLDAQIETTISHEGFIPLPWKVSSYHFEWYKKYLNNLRFFGTIGDIAFYHLNYINLYLNDFPNIKFVCFKRNKQDTINSLFELSNKFNVNHWTDKSSSYWDKNISTEDSDSLKFRYCFPKYDLNKLDALNKYYDDYYIIAEHIEKQIPNIFRIFDMKETLNSVNGQMELFKFLEINNPIIIEKLKYKKIENPDGLIR